MTYVSLNFFALVICLLVVYYIMPHKWRWFVLLLGSIAFYYFAFKQSWYIVLGTAVFSYIFGLLIKQFPKISKLLTIVSIAGVTIPWILTKSIHSFLIGDLSNIIAPLGISFYTLGIISYLVDINVGRIKPEKNILKYILYVIYFPQLVQGPIPRYGNLSAQFASPKKWDENMFMRGVLSIMWGMFLKLMIADRVAVVVNPIFEDYSSHLGAWVVIGIFLFSIQLYSDFTACISISMGVSRLFGIELQDNFNQPFFATSIGDFWRRWHISLSSWLKDYIYIPLGGSRKGKARKILNMMITFAFSGYWHGLGIHFIVWGVMQAVYQFFEGFIYKIRFFNINAKPVTYLRRVITYILFLLSLIVFKAPSTRCSLVMYKSIITTNNWGLLKDGTLLNLGVNGKNWIVVAASLLVLIIASTLRERGVDIKGKILSMPLPVRWSVYLIVIFTVMTFGYYGYGFDAQSFIYGGF